MFLIFDIVPHQQSESKGIEEIGGHLNHSSMPKVVSRESKPDGDARNLRPGPVVPPALRAQWLRDYPWMRKYLGKSHDHRTTFRTGEEGTKRRRTKKPVVAVEVDEVESDHEDGLPPPEDPKDRKQRIARELGSIRDELAWDVRQSQYFYTKVDGGDWTDAHRHKTADGISAHPRQGLPTLWARLYQLKVAPAWKFTTHTKWGALMLAEEYAKKCHFYFMIYKDAPVKPYHYTEDDKNGYVYSEAFLDWAESVPEGGPSFQRVGEILAMVPKLLNDIA
jgi:hypothetical protein